MHRLDDDAHIVWYVNVEVKTGVEVAKKGERNDKIAKKSLKANSAAYAYASKDLCRVVTLCLGYGLKCADDLSCRSLRASDGKNGVSTDAINTTSLPITGRP
ncbi:hypothetical protein PIB30_071914 [Stylosanthes scabra]|uniref:Uncharacterized protein n=1 Tax=Stylosanthes scabra TaxID=79078 RepID=A0ABU6USM8_9FABA|nr:hypothetical protein [Stylosanthes scabra]